MGALIDLIIAEGSVIDLILLMAIIGLTGYVLILKRRVEVNTVDLKEAKNKYHLLNNMVEKVALFIEPIIKRKLIKQAPGQEWTANNPLSGD